LRDAELQRTMPFDRTVKDEDILTGFASLHQAMTEGLARMDRKFVAIEARFA
jgi:hypothetical protein